VSALPLPPEEQARADFYALLARLWYAPPDRGLLELIASSRDLEAMATGSALTSAWRSLKAASADAEAEAIREEYEQLFIGTGKAAVTPYASAYLDTSGGRNPLVEVRDFMMASGFTRRANAFEPEDHIAALCDMMRQLIAQQRGIDAERELFCNLIGPATAALCDAISEAPGARFYRHVAALGRAFFDIEHAAFELG